MAVLASETPSTHPPDPNGNTIARPRGHIPCTRCSMKDVPSTPSSRPARDAAVRCAGPRPPWANPPSPDCWPSMALVPGPRPPCTAPFPVSSSYRSPADRRPPEGPRAFELRAAVRPRSAARTGFRFLSPQHHPSLAVFSRAQRSFVCRRTAPRPVPSEPSTCFPTSFFLGAAPEPPAVGSGAGHAKVGFGGSLWLPRRLLPFLLRYPS